MTETQGIQRRIRQIRLMMTKLVKELFSGSYQSIFKGFGLEFDEIREYVAGDDPRMIDWNVFARTEELYSKTFREEREVAMMIIVDCSASMLESGQGDSRKFDHLMILFALFGFAAVLNQDRVGSVFFHRDIVNFYPPRKGRQYVMQQLGALIGQLERGEQNRGSQLKRALQVVSQKMSRRGICVILSDFLSQSYEKELALLAHRHDVIAIRLNAKHYMNFPHLGLVNLRDLETGESAYFWGYSRRLKRSYHNFWTKHQSQWEKTCSQLKVKHYSIDTDESPEKRIYQYLSRRQVRSNR